MQRMLVLGTVALVGLTSACAQEPTLDDSGDLAAIAEPLTARTALNPRRTSVYDANGQWLATFTVGARSVRVRGPYRTFAEPATTTATVRTHNWVRLLDAPFAGVVDYAWLSAELADRSPDVLAIAMQYTTGAPPTVSLGTQISGDASYGPLVDGVRQRGSDFNDYLGLSWRYPSGYVVEPDPTRLRSVDCSGYQRLVWGYRAGLPMIVATGMDGTSLPRKTADIYARGPGVIVVPHTPGVQIVDFSALATGDLVFMDAQTDDGTELDHTGMFLGVDDLGHYRFVNSRKVADGPTMGDLGGQSILDGQSALYARTFRAIRRL